MILPSADAASSVVVVAFASVLLAEASVAAANKTEVEPEVTELADRSVLDEALFSLLVDSVDAVLDVSVAEPVVVDSLLLSLVSEVVFSVLVSELSVVAVVGAVSVASKLLVSVLSELAVMLVASLDVLVVVAAETVPPVVSMNDTPIKADAKPKLYFLKPKRCFCSSLCS